MLYYFIRSKIETILRTQMNLIWKSFFFPLMFVCVNTRRCDEQRKLPLIKYRIFLCFSMESIKVRAKNVRTIFHSPDLMLQIILFPTKSTSALRLFIELSKWCGNIVGGKVFDAYISNSWSLFMWCFCNSIDERKKEIEFNWYNFLPSNITLNLISQVNLW